jgi:hypothetical protein
MPEVTLTRPSVYEVNGVRLMPGVNTVTAEQLSRLMSNKHVAADFARGMLVKGGDTSADDEPAVVDDADALVDLAQGDGRRSDVRSARATLEEMGIDWQ